MMRDGSSYACCRHEMVEMVMQQLAAAPPRAMGQMPELKFVNEAGKWLGGQRDEAGKGERTGEKTGF